MLHNTTRKTFAWLRSVAYPGTKSSIQAPKWLWGHVASWPVAIRAWSYIWCRGLIMRGAVPSFHHTPLLCGA